SSINQVGENGLCPKCDQNKENTEKYGSMTTIRECWTCGTTTDQYNSNAAGDIFCQVECNLINQIIYRINRDQSSQPKNELIDRKTQEVLRRKNEDYMELESDPERYIDEIKRKVEIRLTGQKIPSEFGIIITNQYNGHPGMDIKENQLLLDHEINPAIEDLWN